MTRVAVALAVVIALAAGVWMLWPDDERAPSTTTTVPVAASSSTTSTPAGSTTTTAEDDHIVETVEEAEEILRTFWFGWYSGFFHEDPELIRKVVVTEEQVQVAVSRFGTLEFERAPTPEDFDFGETEILRSEESCLAIWATFAPTFLTVDGSTSGVNVFRRHDGTWRSLSYWMYRGDLWADDCAAVLP